MIEYFEAMGAGWHLRFRRIPQGSRRRKTRVGVLNRSIPSNAWAQPTGIPTRGQNNSTFVVQT
jgi:hypothetical protein